MKKIFSILLALVLVCSFSLVISAPVAANTDWHVYEGESIQAAVDGASPGDTIIVHEGVYTEAVVISTNDITLEGDSEAVLDGAGLVAADGIAINNSVTGVTVQGFKIRNYRDGIVLSYYSHGNRVIGNEVSASGRYGIYLRFSRPGNEVIENDVSASGSHGIYLNYSHWSEVIGNEVSGSGGHGIFVEWTQHNLIEENEVSDNARAGVAFWRATNNKVIGNEVSASGGHGINLQHSHSNEVIGNEVSGGLDGILVRGSGYNLIEENEVSDSGWNGINLCCGTSNNEVIGNEVSGSGTYDLHWDGTGTGNVWEENEYDTSNLP